MKQIHLLMEQTAIPIPILCWLLELHDKALALPADCPGFDPWQLQFKKISGSRAVKSLSKLHAQLMFANLECCLSTEVQLHGQGVGVVGEKQRVRGRRFNLCHPHPSLRARTTL